MPIRKPKSKLKLEPVEPPEPPETGSPVPAADPHPTKDVLLSFGSIHFILSNVEQIITKGYPDGERELYINGTRVTRDPAVIDEFSRFLARRYPVVAFGPPASGG